MTRLVEALPMNAARVIANMTPAVLAGLATVLANLPVSFSGGFVPPPLLGLGVLYFWTLLRPDLVSPVLVLAIGLAEDFLSGGPPGLWAVGYLAAYALTDRQRDVFAGLSGWGVVIGFTAAMLAAAFMVYLVGSLAYWRLTPVQPLVLQSLVTIVLYPLVAIALGAVHRNLVGASRGDD